MAAAWVWTRCAAVAVVLAGGQALSDGVGAQVPPDLAAANQAIGKSIDPVATAKLYGPIAERPPYKEARITRDISYGPEKENLLDVFRPAAGGGRPRPVVIFASGGESTRIEHRPNAEYFYDNVMLWAVKHGMIGVNTDRRPWRAHPWDTGAKDIAAMIAWTRQNIAQYGGDPERIFFFGHAFGATQLSSYLAHPEFWANQETPGLKGALLVSAPENLSPLVQPSAQQAINPMFDPAHGNLEGLKALKLPLFVGAAEMDSDATMANETTLRDQLCSVGRCPEWHLFRDHQHISVVFSFNTADESVSGPALAWIRSAK